MNAHVYVKCWRLFHLVRETGKISREGAARFSFKKIVRSGLYRERTLLLSSTKVLLSFLDFSRNNLREVVGRVCMDRAKSSFHCRANQRLPEAASVVMCSVITGTCAWLALYDIKEYSKTTRLWTLSSDFFQPAGWSQLKYTVLLLGHWRRCLGSAGLEPHSFSETTLTLTCTSTLFSISHLRAHAILQTTTSLRLSFFFSSNTNNRKTHEASRLSSYNTSWDKHCLEAVV